MKVSVLHLLDVRSSRESLEHKRIETTLLFTGGKCIKPLSPGTIQHILLCGDDCADNCGDNCGDNFGGVNADNCGDNFSLKVETEDDYFRAMRKYKKEIKKKVLAEVET